MPKFKSGDEVMIVETRYDGLPSTIEYMTIISYYPPTTAAERTREELSGPYYKVQLSNFTVTYRHERRMQLAPPPETRSTT